MNNMGCFYTEQHVSKLLVAKIKQNDPKYVLDLGAGNGSLLRAAYDRWSDSNFYATEINPFSLSILSKELPFANLFHVNGLCPDLPGTLNLRVGSIDVAICNPPYLRIKNRVGMEDLFNEAGLKKCFKLPILTSDIIFLAQNIQMLRQGGELGIILPDSLLTGYNFILLRESLLENHGIIGIIQLPDKIFSKTEARTHIILLKKGEPSPQKIPLYMADKSGKCDEKKVIVSADKLLRRMDFLFHAWQKDCPAVNTSHSLADLGIEITRGKFFHKDFLAKDLPCFHTSDFPASSATGINFKTNVQGDGIAAKVGDILLARVGKRCIGRVAKVVSGSQWITDCVYRIRAPERYQKKVFRAFISSEGQAWLHATAHGVCAQIISKKDLLTFPIKLGKKHQARNSCFPVKRGQISS